MPIRKLSKKREAQNREYLKRRLIFLEDKICPVTKQPATQIHHMKGRIGALLTDESNWLAVSAEGHHQIEMNPLWAKKMGYSKSRL